MPDALLDQLKSRAEITEVVLAYVRGIDRCDEALLRSCFHPDARHKHGGFEGLSSDFCGRAMEICRGVVSTHHQLGPVSIDLRGEIAFTETYFTAHHRFGPTPPAGGRAHEDRFMGGRYIDRFERRDGVWKIAQRTGVNDWLRYEASADGGFWDGPADQRGRRDESDPVYSR
ncbi:MAG: nuclear transport factor 2 family protein [Caulobacterales bacterium]|nr:nuclear transport factor 2 family protein [Caulobacterales bacterium]